MIIKEQSNVLEPSQVVPYESYIRQAYPRDVINHENFVGFKVLIPDQNMTDDYNSALRLRQLDEVSNVAFRGKGVLMREIDKFAEFPGIWLVTMPVPKSQMIDQLQNMFDCVFYLQQNLDMPMHGMFEINVSGRCSTYDVDRFMSSIIIPDQYKDMIVPDQKSCYKYGTVQRINDQYVLFRTKWDLNKYPGNMSFKDIRDIITFCTLTICNAFQ